MGDLLEHWFAQARDDYSPKTVLETRSYLDRDLLPALGRVPLSKLRPEDLDRFYRGLRAHGSRGRPLAPASIRRIHGILRRANEVALRAQLRLSLDDSATRAELPLRQGRRITWFEDALAPVRAEMRPQSFRRLTLALAGVVSLEVLIWLVDLGGLSREGAIEQIIWTVEQIVRSTTLS